MTGGITGCVDGTSARQELLAVLRAQLDHPPRLTLVRESPEEVRKHGLTPVVS